MNEAQARLDVCAIGRRRPGTDHWLLKDVSFTVEGGDRIAIVGNTGAGKTVLLRAISLLDPLDAGEIRWGGSTIRGDHVPAYRGNVVYQHQRPSLFKGTVRDNLQRPYAMKLHRTNTFDEGVAIELLQQLDRDASFLEKDTENLSGGEGQLVALVRTLQFSPRVLLLDEPTAALDTRTAQRVERLIGHWLRQAPDTRAVLWISHDSDQAERVSNRQLRIRAGQIVPDR